MRYITVIPTAKGYTELTTRSLQVTMVTLITVILVAALAAALFVRYIRLLRLSARVEESWGELRLLLQRRSELIPPIAGTIQRYVWTEKEIYRRLVAAQHQAGQVAGVRARSDAEARLQTVLRELLAVVEAYPQLRAHDGLRQLQGELLDVEVRLRRSAQAYNKAVTSLKRSRRLPHARIAASMAGVRGDPEMFGAPASLLQ